MYFQAITEHHNLLVIINVGIRSSGFIVLFRLSALVVKIATECKTTYQNYARAVCDAWVFQLTYIER